MDLMDSCYLCGSKNVVVNGCYVAKKNDRGADFLLGKVEAGKTRTYWYGLCQKCFSLSNKEELIEKKIESDMKMQRGYSIKYEK
jgi:hypothetical protein